MLESLTIDTFAGRIGERFRIVFEPESASDAELVEATQLSPPAGERRAPFSLVFRVDSGEPHEQRIYPVQHDELGELELFLVPITAGEDGVRYEAVFT